MPFKKCLDMKKCKWMNDSTIQTCLMNAYWLLFLIDCVLLKLILYVHRCIHCTAYFSISKKFLEILFTIVNISLTFILLICKMFYVSYIIQLSQFNCCPKSPLKLVSESGLESTISFSSSFLLDNNIIYKFQRLNIKIMLALGIYD